MTNYERGMKLLRGGYTAYTPDFAAQAKKAGYYSTVPKEGAVVEFYSNIKGRVGHTGIVVSAVLKNGLWKMQTVEGNSSPGIFTTDGGCVALHEYEFLPGQVGGRNRINGFLYPDFCADTCGAGQFISVARSQIGYCEKASNAQLDDFRGNPGKANFTKYGRWAKECGWGYNPAEWCAMFVSWCAYMACKIAHDYEPGWIQQDDGSWMYRRDGDFVRDAWVYDGGRWYVFDGAGKMLRGWFRDGLDWFYLADDGGMCASQWITSGDKSYYMTASGQMARNAYVKADKPYAPGKYIFYWVDENGVWKPEWDTDSPHLEVYPLAC